MKKFIITTLAVSALALAGCSSSPAPEQKTTTPETEEEGTLVAVHQTNAIGAEVETFTSSGVLYPDPLALAEASGLAEYCEGVEAAGDITGALKLSCWVDTEGSDVPEQVSFAVYKSSEDAFAEVDYILEVGTIAREVLVDQNWLIYTSDADIMAGIIEQHGLNS